jgi:hypothetical protein
LTGITTVKFDGLLEEMNVLYEEWNRKRLGREMRKRIIGGGNQYTLCLGDRLLLLLMYYRTYQTYAFFAFLFGIDESNIGRNFRPLEPLLAQIFRIPERKIEISDEEFTKIFFDGSEQPTERPTKRQKRWYSGKKKQHTRKFQVAVIKQKKKPGRGKTKKRKLRIAAVTKVVPGKMHDKRLYDQSKTHKPPGSESFADTGYVGTNMTIPHKQSKKHKLTKKQKKYNKKLSSERVCVEHAIGKMKIWRIAKEKIRNTKSSHSLRIKNIAGLHNLIFA